MMKGWEVKPLGAVSKITYGYTEKASLTEIGPKFLRITDIQDNQVDWNTVPYCKIDKSEIRKYALTHGDIVFARTGATTGKSFLVTSPPPAVYASYLIKLHITESMRLTPEFLYLYFQTKTYWDHIAAGVSGSAQGGFNATKLAEISIPIPPLPEQHRIVAILDEVFESINRAKDIAERNLRNAREIFQSYTQIVFAVQTEGWVECTLGEVCEKITDGTHLTPTYIPEGIPFLSVKNLTNGSIDLSDTRFISLEEHKFLTRRCRPEREDILYTKVGTTGVAKVVDIDDEFSIFVSVALLKIKHKAIYNRYLEYFLNSPYAREQAKKRTRGMANKNLVINDIKQINIRYPLLLADQNIIVAKLDSISTEVKKLESIYQQKLTDLEELKKSVLQKAFNGELTS